MLRSNLLDASRPHVETDLGAPVEFVVLDMRVSGDAAFAQVTAQRPGGVEIDLSETPLVVRDGVPEGMIDGTRTEAFYLRSGAQWVVLHHAIGATDVWYADTAFCEEWSKVIPTQSLCDGS